MSFLFQRRALLRPYSFQRLWTTKGTRFLTTTTTTTKGDEEQPQVLMQTLVHDEHPDRYITHLILNRPKANAMGSIMLDQLSECLDNLSTSGSRCVILTSSSPKVFSAGADLKERKKMTPEEAEAFVTRLRDTMQRVAALHQPVIAAIEGVALGGGLELALACDLRIASVNATLGLPETSLAIIPGAGGTQRLPRLIGAAKAKELIWTGRRISGDEAYSLGLVDQVVEPGRTLEGATKMGWRFAENGPIAIQASKRAIDDGLMASNMEEALGIERLYYGKTLPTQDRLEGLAAFNEGRKPNYRGV